ncbi:hypothetical protein HK105_204656 [Polyrhizophydium stewartii]|uniref:SAM-dependent MTase RsmB/NOP-type domain-containing protein n=1 Tax=Polyrhizophydium stewartii TaxID=2732419 RepID=A0ABR4N879_9FUNG|nr:hypothetical protein HK105_007814 [Polyrhizophydium stewartii]
MSARRTGPTAKTLAAFADARSRHFAPSELAAMLAVFGKPRRTSFRVNAMRATDAAAVDGALAAVRQRLSELHARNRDTVRIRRCAWNSHAFQLSDPSVRARQLMDLDAHARGLLHFQSLSSMIPAACFDPSPLVGPASGGADAAGAQPRWLLDMCAAPGGKTTQLVEAFAARTSNVVVANEIHPLRIQRLERNIAALVPEPVRPRVHQVLGDGRRLAVAAHGADPAAIAQSKLPRLMDAILLDAPCSGEGTFSTLEPQTIAVWSLDFVAKMQRLQRQLLDRAFHLLRPGGQLVYSTCTLGPEENEANIEWVVGQHPSLEIAPLHLDLADPAINGGLANFRPAGGPSLGSRSGLPLHLALRVLPTAEYEGFFVCRLVKRAA